eukprot:TRINITY_DN3689_c0_g1_i1.p1 TRINITY_DN3689_c0_g1~~TRINITY_DN3689_c0_g1_i1.p1  ORF type:complete len:399 (-),score=-56.27 TRINITY_DN3689_c0_g1_i1:1152-2348(-)
MLVNNVSPIGGYGIGVNKQFPIMGQTPQKPKIQTPQKPNNRAINFLADSGGCGHYRMVWPSFLMTAKEKYHIFNMNKIVPNDGFYQDLNVLRIQRQVSDEQYEVAKFLRKVCDKHGVRFCYEIDDIPLYEDIPDYNNHKKAYANPSYRNNIINIMNMCDEVTVTNKFMRDYFISKTSATKITVVPNFMPRFWIDRYYDENKLRNNFNNNKKKPRVLYPGSAAHYDISGKIPDDMTEIVKLMGKTLNEFQWVIFGGMCPSMVDWVKSGKVEYHPFVDLMDYPQKIVDIKPQFIVAPLQKNNFNFAKSDIKFREGAALGIPTICQDMITYEKSLYKFDNNNDLYDQIKTLSKDVGVYIKACRKMREKSNNWWLEDNINVWEEFYTHPFGDSKRKNLIKYQ